MTRIILRMVFGILLVLVASFLIGNWGFQRARERLVEEELPRLRAELEQARDRLEGIPPERFEPELRKLAKELGYSIKVIDKGSPEVTARARRQLRRGRRFAVSGRRGKQRIFVPLGPGRDLAMLKGSSPPFHFPIAVVGSSILAVVAVVAFVLAFPMVRRLRRLEQTAERISQGDLEARAEVNSADAFGSLARRFNLMADRVQELLESQKQLIRAVSHELRTPISRLHFGLEMLDKADSPDERAERTASLEQDLAELENLIQELLTYIKAGDRALELDRQPVAPAAVLAELGSRLGELRPEVTLELPAADAALPDLDADPRHLRRALKNLLHNALRHARAKVVVRQKRRGDQLLLEVCDDGPGVPPVMRQQVFEPFARLDNSRSRESGGVGLGLAIVSQIAAAHGGSVTLDDAPEGGAMFTLAWPVHPSAGTPAATI